MSDGGGESVRSSERQRGRGGGGGGDEFGRAVARLAVAQICEAAGFQGFEQSALDTLSDVAIRYLRDLGKTAKFYANVAGRTECNVFDVAQGLEDLSGSTQGFLGASDVNRCLLGSGALREVEHYVGTAEEIPFVGSIPRFPIRRGKKTIPSFAQIGEVPPGSHIPDWLPAFPDPHTYIDTPVWNERSTDPKADRIEQVKQRQKAESSLLNLQQKLANGAMEHGPSVAVVELGREKITAEGNPFLVPPLQPGEKDVSLVTVPDRFSKEVEQDKRVSLVETFAPVIEAAKSGSIDNIENERTMLPSVRPTVKFRCGVDKKLLTVPLALSRQDPGTERLDHWFGRNDEKDDKKRRAEQILKQAIENPRDLAQL